MHVSLSGQGNLWNLFTLRFCTQFCHSISLTPAPHSPFLARSLASSHYWKRPLSLAFSPSLSLSLLDLQFQKRIKILNPGREWLLLADLAGSPLLPFPLPFLLYLSISLPNGSRVQWRGSDWKRGHLSLSWPIDGYTKLFLVSRGMTGGD